MILCLSDWKQSTASSKLTKLKRSQKRQIAYVNEKQDNILSHVK